MDEIGAMKADTLRSIQAARASIAARMAALRSGKSGSKTYQPNGARECARRRKQAVAAAVKRDVRAIVKARQQEKLANFAFISNTLNLGNLRSIVAKGRLDLRGYVA